MITSKQLIDLTGISRATLNNYIALGILPNPVVLPPQAGDERATRMGHFPDEAIERVKQVQALKKEGLSMTVISQRFQDKLLGEPPGSSSEVQENHDVSKLARPDVKATFIEPEQRPPTPLTLEVSIDDIPGPAYMVNNNFELVWWNQQAIDSLFQESKYFSGDIESRNLIRLLMRSQHIRDMENWHELMYIHLCAAKKRLVQQTLIKVYSSLPAKDIQLLDQLYEAADSVERMPIVHWPTTLPDESGKAIAYNLYASFFREGILITYISALEDDSSLLDLLSRRNHVIRDLMRKRKPFITNVAVMVADLQNSVRICSELPAEEYFELINLIWQSSEPIFRKYYGTHGKHVGDGMVYYFFPQPDCNYILNAIHCSFELKEMMRNLSREWQSRKGWLNDLYLNIGLNEGQEWFGTYHTGSHLEFTVLGDTINHAARISDFARDGAIWTTKNMLSQIPIEQRQAVHFGIRRRTDQGDEVLVNEMYARISNLVNLNEGQNIKFQDIAVLPITEIIDLATGEQED